MQKQKTVTVVKRYVRRVPAKYNTSRKPRKY